MSSLGTNQNSLPERSISPGSNNSLPGEAEIEIAPSSVADAIGEIDVLIARAKDLGFPDFCGQWKGSSASSMERLFEKEEQMREGLVKMLENARTALDNARKHFEETDRTSAQDIEANLH